MKYIKYLTLVTLGIFIIPISVNAANANVTIYSNLGTVVVGNQVNITFQISSSVALGSWNYQISYDTNLFNFKSCSNQALTQVGVISNDNTKSISVTCYFTAKARGTGSFTIRNADIFALDESKMGVTNSSKSVTVITQADLEASYSKNSNLSALSVTGYEITPAFNKDTLEYNLEVENDVRNITINATKEDSKSSINGAGAKTIEEGLNKFAIEVTAQNGTKKTYTINITVKELTPVKVTIDNKEYTVIRKKDLLKIPNTFYKDTTVKIGEFDIPAFINETINYVLIGLKDSDNNIKLYVYNKDNDTYREYIENSFNGLILEILNDSSKISNKYEKTTITINEKEVTGYKFNKASKYALVYAKNIATGEDNIYMYDSHENTVQRYNNEEVEKLEKEYKETKKLYEYIIVGIGSFLIITYLVFLISLISKEKKRKKLLKELNENKEILDDNFTNNSDNNDNRDQDNIEITSENREEKKEPKKRNKKK